VAVDLGRSIRRTRNGLGGVRCAGFVFFRIQRIRIQRIRIQRIRIQGVATPS